MSQVTEQSVRFQTALASIKLIQASAVLDLTEDDFDFLTSNKVWIATDRDRKSGSAGMPRPISYAVFCLKKKKAMVDVMQSKLVKRQLSLKILKPGPIEPAAKGNVRQTLELQQGIDDELARSLVKQIKQVSPKVQPRIQGDTIRVSSREKDLLQQVIAALKASETQVPLQFINYR